MHVLYFHQHFSTPQGATGTRSYEMARRLIAKGHKVTMVCGYYREATSGLTWEFVNGMRRGVVDGIDVIQLQLDYSNYDSFFKRTWIFVLFAIRSIWLALTLQYNLLFATSTPLTAGIPGIFARFFLGKPFVFEVRDLWPEGLKAMGGLTNPLILGLLGVLEWVTYHSANRCIGLSPGIVDGIVKRGIKQKNVVMIPNGCDLDKFVPETGNAWRPDGERPNDFLAVFSGAHGLANSLDSVLDAAAELQARNCQDIKIVFVGDGKLKPKLRKRAETEKLENCTFLDPIPKTKLNKLLQGAGAGLMILGNAPAFYFGTSPNKFFDYIAAGLPVVNNYPGWLASLITRHECGIVVEPENPRAFADALELLANNREMAKRMGKNARSLAESKFSRDLLAERFVSFLEECASQ